MAARKKYFAYHATGSAFGGVITSPSPITVPTQAMAALAPSGGYGTSTVENFGIKDLLCVRCATTTVQGDPKQTELTVTLEDVDLLGVVSVSRMVLHMVSRPLRGETAVSPAGSEIEGLKVNGKEIKLSNRAEVFDRQPAYSQLEEAYRRNELRGLILSPASLGEPCKGRTFAECAGPTGDVKATLFPLSECGSSLPVVHGGLRLENFGTLYLGDYRISRFTRRLTMLRIELGCSRDGSMAFGDGLSNGHEEPPSEEG